MQPIWLTCFHEQPYLLVFIWFKELSANIYGRMWILLVFSFCSRILSYSIPFPDFNHKRIQKSSNWRKHFQLTLIQLISWSFSCYFHEVHLNFLIFILSWVPFFGLSMNFHFFYDKIKIFNLIPSYSQANFAFILVIRINLFEWNCEISSQIWIMGNW